MAAYLTDTIILSNICTFEIVIGVVKGSCFKIRSILYNHDNLRWLFKLLTMVLIMGHYTTSLSYVTKANIVILHASTYLLTNLANVLYNEITAL